MGTPLRMRRIPAGDAGTFVTLRVMRRLVNRGLGDGLVLDVARRVASGARGRDATGRAELVRLWLDRTFRFVRDPRGIEYLQSPQHQLRNIRRRGVSSGDCDDAAILGAAIGKAAGLRARFVVLGFLFPKAPFKHIYVELETPLGWRDLDVTKPAQKLPMRISRTFKALV